MNKALKKEIVKFLQTDANKYHLTELQEEVNKRFNTNASLSIVKHMCYDNNIQWKRKYRKHQNQQIGDEIQFSYDPNDVRIRTGKGRYMTKKRYLYEKYHNVKLKKDDVIIFLNHDFTDYSKENLVKISRRYMAILSRIGYTNDDTLNNLAIDIAKLRIKTYDRMKEGI